MTVTLAVMHFSWSIS